MDVALDLTLRIKFCHRADTFSEVRGRITPRVESGFGVGVRVFGGGVYVSGDRGMTRDFVQLTVPPVAM
jgi:hypothetical protein